MFDKTAMHDLFGPILIGLSATMSPSLAHGYVHTATAEKYGLVSDKYHRLVSPSQKDIDDIFEQIRKMGIDPKYLEIKVPGKDAIVIAA